MQYRWVHRPIASLEHLERMRKELNNLPEALARALMLRGIDTFESARLFFRPSREHLHDAFMMKDMDAGAERLAEAVRRNERVLVYGDYDVDGTTATTLMTSFLRGLGLDVSYFIPDRFADGYGLKQAGIERASEVGASLVIALDCGITAVDEARYAASKGLDLIICDHHTPKHALPDAIAVIDPKRSDCPYPFKELSGCGLGYKLAGATLQKLGRDPAEVDCYLDLVAISTASDIVPMVGENRILMREGLDVIRTSPRSGVQQLAHVAGLDLDRCATSEIVFGIGPRINAAGRLAHASLAVDLLLSEDAAEAHSLAKRLEELNHQRRSVDQDTMDEAVVRAERQITSGMRHSVVLHDPDWHLGVIGIVASRIVERYYRPAIMLTTSQGELKGSARSIAGLNIFEALRECSDLLTQFGGHDFAAGLSLPEENLSAFQTRFDEVARERLDPDLLVPAIEVDAPLRLDEIDRRFWSVLKQFGPFGPDNPRPIFHAARLQVCGRPRLLGRDGQHLKFRARDVDGSPSMDVIAFKMGTRLPMLQQSLQAGIPLEALFSVEENHWNGRSTLQLRARDLRLGGEA